MTFFKSEMCCFLLYFNKGCGNTQITNLKSPIRARIYLFPQSTWLYTMSLSTLIFCLLIGYLYWWAINWNSSDKKLATILVAEMNEAREWRKKHLTLIGIDYVRINSLLNVDHLVFRLDSFFCVAETITRNNGMTNIEFSLVLVEIQSMRRDK